MVSIANTVPAGYRENALGSRHAAPSAALEVHVCALEVRRLTSDRCASLQPVVSRKRSPRFSYKIEEIGSLERSS